MSIAIVLATASRIIAASDSRAFDAERTSFEDDVRKIDIEGEYLFAATGCGQVAMNAFWETGCKPVAGESAKDRALRVLDTIGADLPEDAPSGELLFGIFRYASSVADGYAIKLRLVPAEARIEILQQEAVLQLPFGLIFGWDDGAGVKARCIAETIQPALKLRPFGESSMADLARETIETAAKQSPKIGGPVRVAVIDADGARWVEAAS